MSAEPKDVPIAVQRDGHRRSRNHRAPVTLQAGLPPAPRVRRIHDAASVAAELVTIYRDMRKGRLDTSEGGRMAYVLHLAGRLLAELDVAKEVAKLRAELERVQGTPGVPALPHLNAEPIGHEAQAEPATADITPSGEAT